MARVPDTKLSLHVEPAAVCVRETDLEALAEERISEAYERGLEEGDLAGGEGLPGVPWRTKVEPR